MKYFISYVYFEKGEPLFGNAEWEGEPIRSIREITAIEEEIRQEVGGRNVFVKILFWKPFD